MGRELTCKAGIVQCVDRAQDFHAGDKAAYMCRAVFLGGWYQVRV